MKKIVLDTNVLISALLNPSGRPARILEGILSGSWKLQLDNRILLEYWDVLHRPKFGFKEESILPLMDFIRMESDFIAPVHVEWDFPDPFDRMFYEILEASSADSLITGNLKHFPKDARIMLPSDFLAKG
ncbi:MAG: putative toxin-antitoxin system toxin component, PIN family [Spirochaetales bacterium]|nr:putative toxin-antitoxin system toxin component, PIN family [Spirochaetales bacterium]